MKQLAFLALLTLLTIAVLACGEETPEAADATAPASSTGESSLSTPAPTNTTAPEPTPLPTDTPKPTPATVSTDTSVREPTSTTEPTATPEPTAEPMTPPTLEATATSTAVPTPATTFAPEPTSAPERTQATVPALPIAVEMAPLGDNLLFVAYFNRATQMWSVYDANGNFSPDDLALLPGQEVPDISEIDGLTALKPNQIYSFHVSQEQTADLNNQPITFFPGSNPILWK